MTVAQITPPAPRTDALADHAYCLPVVRELPPRPPTPPATAPGDDLARRRQRPDARDALGLHPPAAAGVTSPAVLEFGILGPLEVRADGRAVALGGAKPRAVLAVLRCTPISR